MQVFDISALRAKTAEMKGQWAAIARAGPFDYSWVVRFAHGDIAEPKLSRLRRLSEVIASLPAPLITQSEPSPEAALGEILGELASVLRDEERAALTIAMERGPQCLYHAIEALEVTLDVRGRLLAAAQRCEERAA